MAVEQRTGRVNSGDVSTFYRAFGTPGRTPILLLHGSNYYDSYDWIGVASGLASNRQVVVFDHRGFGHSGWSEYKDYSLDALFSDIISVSPDFHFFTHRSNLSPSRIGFLALIESRHTITSASKIRGWHLSVS